ncbi:unnamed protein product [Prorocentrum cordatum]|uniref:Uncharacterized protein n=1 Tax=Prorocentrum cordatum TaxID=2364126 RepID=A0ABN9TN24_9DINO|nr:unnamed protein product [Polarella glacialis]
MAVRARLFQHPRARLWRHRLFRSTWPTATAAMGATSELSENTAAPSRPARRQPAAKPSAKASASVTGSRVSQHPGASPSEPPADTSISNSSPVIPSSLPSSPPLPPMTSVSSIASPSSLVGARARCPCSSTSSSEACKACSSLTSFWRKGDLPPSSAARLRSACGWPATCTSSPLASATLWLPPRLRPRAPLGGLRVDSLADQAGAAWTGARPRGSPSRRCRRDPASPPRLELGHLDRLRAAVVGIQRRLPDWSSATWIASTLMSEEEEEEEEEGEEEGGGGGAMSSGSSAASPQAPPRRPSPLPPGTPTARPRRGAPLKGPQDTQMSTHK